MVLGTIAEYDQINVFAITGWWGEIDLVQQGAAAHRDLSAEEIIIEQSHHRPA